MLEVQDQWRHLVLKKCLRYTNYIGDGDSKSYNDILQANPYEGIRVNKLECMRHIQKRVGTRLRKLKSANTKTVLSQ